MKKYLLIAIILALPLAAPAADKRLLIIDDDIGMLKSMVAKAGTYQMPWVKMTDPDGGLELLYALHDSRVEVLGVTCSMGCSTVDVCLASARRLLELAGRTDVPVLRGAASPAEFGRPTDASAFIIKTVMARPGQVEILATAPLTNVGTALKFEPGLAQNWKTLHFATGEFWSALGEPSDAYRFRWTGYQDLNINVDPVAARYVLEHGGVFPIYPNEVMDDAWLTLLDQRRIRDMGTPTARFVADEINPFLWLGLTAGRLAGFHGLYLHGVIPLAIALDPEVAEPPTMRRVTMKNGGRNGFHFIFTDDPAVPERPVYARLTDRERVQRTMVERSR